MSQTQIRGNKQIRSGSITNTEIASDANIALTKIEDGVDLRNRVNDLENDSFITREVPSGSVNGSNVTFTLANIPVSGSEQVYLNGLLQDPGAGNSYTIAGSTITFLSAPLSNDEIHVSYATGDYMVAPAANSSSEIVANSFSTTLSPSSGVLTIDTSTATVFLGALSESVTEWSFTNVPAGNSRILGITLILDGVNTYTYGDACRVNGVAVSGGVKWSGGSAPTSTNNFDIITFVIVVDNLGVVNVFGSSTTNYS
jgi:hypothetical protein